MEDTSHSSERGSCFMLEKEVSKSDCLSVQNKCFICNEHNNDCLISELHNSSGSFDNNECLEYGFSVFCKHLRENLSKELRVEEEQKDKSISSTSSSEVRNCCQLCFGALMDISRLEKIIQDSRNSQLEKFEMLKSALLKGTWDGQDLNSSYNSVEDFLWSWVEGQIAKFSRISKDTNITCSKPSLSRSQSSQRKQRQTFPAVAKEPKINHIDFLKLQIPDVELGVIKTIKMELPDEAVLPVSGDENDYNNGEDLQVDLEISEVNDARCSKRLKLNHNEPPVSSDPLPKTTQSRAPRTMKPLKDARDGYYGTMVYRIKDNLFLFKATVIEFSSCDQRFICKEPACSFTSKGSDYAAFTRIKSHVLKRHYSEEWKYEEKRRNCPICGADYKAHQFKRHISMTHVGKPSQVICEVCGKTTLPSDHLSHAWTHKNEADRIAAIKADTDVPPKLKLKVAQKQSHPFYHLMFPSQAISTPKPKKVRATVSVKKTEISKKPDESLERKTEKKVIKRLPRKRPIGMVKKENEPGLRPNSFIYRLSETCLMYKCNLIGVSKGETILTCLDPACFDNKSFSVEAIGMDYYSAFDKIKLHVDTDHILEQEEKGFSTRRDANQIKEELTHFCPSCNEGFPSGAKLRYHLLKTHKVKEVVCETCWKPLKWADGYRHHAWIHKNEQEREADQLGPPPKIMQHAIRKRINSSFLVLEENHIFMYLFTFIKFSKDSTSSEFGFTCLESGCDYLVQGVDYHAFQQMRSHVKSCHLEQAEYITKSRSCPICPSTLFRDGRFLRKHMIQTHSRKCTCPLCWKTVYYHLDNRYLNAHMQEDHPDHSELDDCKNSTSTSIKTTVKKVKKEKVQKKVQKKEKNFVCYTCGLRFFDPVNLRGHQETHLPKHLRRKLDCPHCPKKFVSQRSLLNHEERLHRPELRRMIECPYCQKQYNSKDTTSYQSHLRKHMNVKPFVCDMCGQSFFSNASLICHQESVHVEERIHCEFCERKYKTLKNLKSHQKAVHSDKLTNS